MEIIETNKGRISVLNDNKVQISNAEIFLDIISSSSSDTLVISKENLTESFFDLKTGIAGEILQKVSNYKTRLIVLGDFNQHKSKSLNDFILESNKMGRVVFTDDINKAIDLLR